MLKQRAEQIQIRVQQLIAQVRDQFNVDLGTVEIRFDLKGRAAGMACIRGNKLSLRFNTQMMQNSSWDHIYNETVPHEVAHLVCFVKPTLGKNHDAGWKRVCQLLGGTGARCHNEPVVYAKGKTYAYTTTTGRQVNVSEKMHTSIQNGASYTVKRDGGRINNQCQYSLAAVSGQPVDTAAKPKAKTATTKSTTAKPKTTNKSSNASLVREQIALAKQQGQDSMTVVAWAVATLGMTLSLAKTYVKNNWARA